MMTTHDPKKPPKPEPTDDELREVAARALARQPVHVRLDRYAEPFEKGLSEADQAISKMLTALRVKRDPPAATPRHTCDGGCKRPVLHRGDWCADCAKRSRTSAADVALREAWHSVNPDGCRDWCRPGNEDYRAAILGTEAYPGIRRLYKKLLVDNPAEGTAAERKQRGDEGLALFKNAVWDDMGSLLLIGPTGIGKTALLSAIANTRLDRARAGQLSNEAFAESCGIRWVSAMDLGKAAARHRLGEDAAPLIRMAKSAKILFLDELGTEPLTADEPLSEVLRARYEPRVKTTFVGSELTLRDLEKRYRTSRIRTIWQRGRLIDLHPRS